MEKINLIVESIDKICSKLPIFENEIVIPSTNNSFILQIYNINDEEDKEYISKNKKQIWKFFDDGYMAAGLGHFVGCTNDKSVKRNTVLLKIAREKVTMDIITMSIYSAHPDGIKCVGLTITTDNKYKNIAKDALRFIIKEDISKFQEYYWCECDGAIRHYYEKFGGTKIPNVYLPAIFKDKFKDMDIKYIDDYEYIRDIGKNTENETTAKKCLFGFPNKEILEEYITKQNTTLEQMIKNIKIAQGQYESLRFISDDVDLALKVLHEYAVRVIETETLTLTEYEYKNIFDLFKILYDYKKKYFDILPANIEKARFNSTFMNIEYLLDCYTIIKPYTFDDELICADTIEEQSILQKMQKL